MVDNVLILDTETTGLEPMQGAKLIEIGAVLYNFKHKAVLQTFSTLLPCDENPVEDINHIAPEWTRCRMGKECGLVFLCDMASNARCIVAHNAQFDEKFMKELNLPCDFNQHLWICTKRNFEWPMKLFRSRLSDICQALGVPYVNAHRALNDCNFLVSCFNKIDNLEQRFENAVKMVLTDSDRYR